MKCKYVFVPCKFDKKGKIIPTKAPHGCHHLLKVYEDGLYQLVATVDGSFRDEGKVRNALRLLVGSARLKIEPDFYKRQSR